MSRKEKKKDSDSGIGTAVAVGAAVALGAAALYGAKKLFDLFSEPEPVPAGATASAAPPSSSVRPKCVDSDSDDDNNLSRIPSTSHRNITSGAGYGDHFSNSSTNNAFLTNRVNDCRNNSSLGARPKNSTRLASETGNKNSLAEELQLYLNMYDFDKSSATKEISIVSQIKQALNDGLKSNLPDDLKMILKKEDTLKEFGSFAEATQIADANGFDMMFPLGLSSENCVVNEDSEGVKYSIKSLNDQSESYCNACGCVDGSKIVNCLETVVSNILKSMIEVDFCCELKNEGNLLSVNVTYVDASEDKKLMVNLYPVVSLDDKCFIPYPSFDNSDQSSNASAWKPFHSKEEQQQLDVFNGELSTHIKLLKIFKAIRQNSLQQFGKLPVYHYKVILYRILEDNSDRNAWCDAALAERFVDFIVELGVYCKERLLQDYFEPRINLFEHINGDVLNNIMLQINKFVGQNDFSTLLERH